MSKLVLSRLSKRYRLEREAREVLAFADVSLEVEEGEFVAIVGPSGCGKTSLLNVVAGLLPFQEGTVAIDGRAVEGPGVDRAVVSLGFSLATVTGVVLGVLLGWYRRARLLLDPFVNALYATPRIAVVPLIILWFGIGIWSKVFVVFLSAFFPILVNTIAGVKALDEDLLRAARSFCASDRQIFTTVAIPGSVPFILAGVRQGVAHGLIGVVVGEMLAGSQGIGFMIAYGGQTFATDTLFVGVAIIAFAGILLTWVAERLQQRFSRWRPSR